MKLEVRTRGNWLILQDLAASCCRMAEQGYATERGARQARRRYLANPEAAERLYTRIRSQMA